MTLQFKSLCSGSKGNATLIQATCGKGSHASSHVLVDCGLSLRQMCLRLQQAGVQPEQISAIFITHEHADHIGCARAFALRYRTPVWMSQGTHAALKQSDFDGLLQYASHAQPIAIGALQLRPFAVPHDAREPLQLCATDGDKTLGIATDLGHATAQVQAQLQHCHALVLEANHDENLLQASAYPAFLKRRIAGYEGHLSNAAAAQLAKSINHARLGHVLAAHLSESNNRPALAASALAAALGRQPSEVQVASAADGSQWLTV